MADDMGWWDAPWINSKSELFMPTFSQLVQEGVTLERHYGFNWCAPSRASLLSGRLPFHAMQQTKDEEGVVNANFGLPVDITALPQKLKAVGYATHAVGKWHLGLTTSKQLPRARGFDTWFGWFMQGEDHFTQVGFDDFTDLWVQNASYNGPAHELAGSAYSDRMFAERAMHILDKHPLEQPVFLFVAFQGPHAPETAPEYELDGLPADWSKDKQMHIGMVRYLDGAMHNITEALKRRGMWEHTFLVFSSDHGSGGVSAGNNWPLLGGKEQVFEGGHRLASFVSGGVLAPSVRGTKQEGYI